MAESAEKKQVGVALPLKPLRLARGTSVTTDMALTRRFHEEFLGLECVQYAKDGMLSRSRGVGGANPNDYWVLDTRLRPAIDNPQCVWNHWGVDVATKDEVDRAHQIALSEKEYYGIDEVQEVRNQHGAYSFYFSDVMGNWWEVQCPLLSKEEVEARRKSSPPK